MAKFHGMAVLLAFALMASSPSAATLYVSFVTVDNSAGSPDTNGMVTVDLLITTDTDWLAGNLIFTLTSGSFFQSPFGGNTAPPSPAIISVFPTSAFDTYVSGKNGVAASSAGGAVDIGGSALSEFSETAIDINWFTTTTDDIGTFSIGRVTFAEDAYGTFFLRLDAANQPPTFVDFDLVGGWFQPWPEPASVSLLGLGAVVLLGRRRGLAGS